MKQLLVTFSLLLFVGFTITDARQQIFNKKTGLINVLLRSNGADVFDKLTKTGGAEKIEGSSPPQWKKPGGLDQAFTDFLKLPGKGEKDQSAGDKIVFTKDMGTAGKVTMRSYSSEGSPTLELQKASGGSKIKAIRYYD